MYGAGHFLDPDSTLKMHIYQVVVQAHCPAPREFVERVEATSYPIAIKRATQQVLRKQLKGKRPYKVAAIAQRLARVDDSSYLGLPEDIDSPERPL